ncbi:MAG: 3-hydroxyacyl-CoA dehydrogenase NAD-binding domain-containing protein, partial [Actinomycetes bacterium]
MAPAELERRLAEAAALSPDAVVTEVLSRDVALPYGAGTLVLLTLDNHADHTRPNTLGPTSLQQLNAALDAALARDDIAAVGLTGKPFILAAGADLKAVARITEREQALGIAQIGHAVLGKLHAAGVPTFAFVNGLALGGGLELALHCDYRTVSAAAAGIALPECFLGMLPGWGGAYLLPNLVGADRAVTVIIENALSSNRMLTGPQTYELGVADAIFAGADFLECSLEWAAAVLAGTVPVERPEIDRGEAWEAAVARGRAFADAKVSGAAPGPYRALDLIAAARTADREAAFAAEDQALADLLLSDELRSGLYAFDLVQKRARKPVGAPSEHLAREVTAVGIVGAGLMASQLALLFARRLQVPVIMSDLDDAQVQRGLAYVHGEVDKLLDRRRISADRANRVRGLVRGTTQTRDFAGCDFVIEAVFEELAVKQAVFADVEQQVGPGCVLATNTSSLSVSKMAAGLDHPERVVGFHFINPVAVMPLLEV